MEKAAKDLTDKIMPIGAKMYEAAKDGEQPASDDAKYAGKKDDSDAVEGEIVDEKDK